MRRFFAICLAISLMLSLTIASAQAQNVSVMADNYSTAKAYSNQLKHKYGGIRCGG